MRTWPHPRVFIWSALAMFLLGIGLLYAGLLSSAPMALFASIVLCVLAVIATNVLDIQRLLARQPTSTEALLPDQEAEPAEDRRGE